MDRIEVELQDLTIWRPYSEELSEHYLGRLTGKTGEAYGSGHKVKSYASAVAKIEFSDYVGSQPTANLSLQYQPSKQDGG